MEPSYNLLSAAFSKIKIKSSYETQEFYTNNYDHFRMVAFNAYISNSVEKF